MGLIDTDTGLAFGEGLQFQTAIGGAGLQIATATLAELLLGEEPDGVAMAFVDMSMVIRVSGVDTFNGSPASKLLGTTLRTSTSGLLLASSDNVYLPTSEFPYSSTEGLIALRASSSTNNFDVAAALNNGGNYAAGPGVLLRINSTSQVAVGGNATTVSSTVSPVLSASEMISFGGCIKTAGTTMAACNRGGTVTTAATLDWNGTSNRLQLGTLDAFGAQALTGVMEWIVYLPTYNTTKLQSLTA